MKKYDRIEYLNELLRSGAVNASDALDILQMTTYSSGEKVRIVDMFNDHFGMEGTIIRHDKDDDSYLIEFEYNTPWGATKTTEWYHSKDDFVYANKPSPIKNPFIGVDVANHSWCSHEWQNDSFFTTRIYKTCRKCGKRHEDL